MNFFFFYLILKKIWGKEEIWMNSGLRRKKTDWFWLLFFIYLFFIYISCLFGDHECLVFRHRCPTWVFQNLRVSWKVHRLIKILFWNDDQMWVFGMFFFFFNIVSFVVKTLLPLKLQCLDPISQQSHQLKNLEKQCCLDEVSLIGWWKKNQFILEGWASLPISPTLLSKRVYWLMSEVPLKENANRMDLFFF